MKPSLARGLARAGLLVAALGCGAAPPAPAPAVALPLGPASIAPAPPAAAAEAGPSAPEELALLVRVNDPEQLAREIVSLLPAGAAAALTALQPRDLVQMLVGKRLGEVVDLTQPIDVASVGRESSFVVSLAVKPESESRLGEGLTLREEGGLVHVGKPDEARVDAARMSACAFTAASGRAATRLVCATDPKALEATARYLARTVAAESFDADARLTLPGRVLRDKRDGASKTLGEAASARLGAALVERFVEEIERVDVDLRLGAGPVELTFDLRLSGRESMVARVLVPRSTAAPPPRAFYRLPADSLLALHTTGALPEDIAPLRTAIAENVESSLVQDGYPAERARVVRERVEALLFTGGPLVLAMGVAGGREGAEKALGNFESAQGKGAEERQAEARVRASLVPWAMAEVDEPPERWTQGLRALLQATEEAERARTLGRPTSAARDPDGSHVDVRLGALDAKWGLPKDTLHLEVLVAPRTKGRRPTRKGHLFAVPKGATTWLGYSEDLAVITSRLRTALDTATEVGTLARSPEALTLQSRSALVAGLGTAAGLGLLTAETGTAPELLALARSAAGLGRLTSRGAETMVATVSADATAGATHTALRLQLSRQSAMDFTHLLGL